MNTSPGSTRPSYCAMSLRIASWKLPMCMGVQIPLSEGEPLGVEQRGGEVERVAHDPRVRGAHQGERHVVGDGVEAALHELELERVDVSVGGVHEDCDSMWTGRFMPRTNSMATLPSPSRPAEHSGGTTHVPFDQTVTTGDIVPGNVRIPRDQDQTSQLRLHHEKAIERIAVMHGQTRTRFHMREVDTEYLVIV